jgi:transposase
MEKLIKQCVGIDVAKNELDVTFSSMSLDQSITYVQSRKFKNTPKSFEKFKKWTLKFANKELPLFFTMESTGVYHEKLACFLFENEFNLSVVLPNKASNYAKTLDVKTVTDKEASKYLSRMGLEKKLDLWRKPDEIFNKIKQLTREREQLMKNKTIASNQLHAEQSGAWVNSESVKRAKKRMKFIAEQIAAIATELEQLINENPELKKKIDFVTSIPGVGLITAATVIGETNGFGIIENKRQLVSYCGYDVIRKDSGTSVHSKPRISKRGNKHVRRAMHYPALSSIKCNEQSKNTFKRIVEKTSIKMKGAVAVQRKLLILIYTLWKKEEYFDEAFYQKK